MAKDGGTQSTGRHRLGKTQSPPASALQGPKPKWNSKSTLGTLTSGGSSHPDPPGCCWWPLATLVLFTLPKGHLPAGCTQRTQSLTPPWSSAGKRRRQLQRPLHTPPLAKAAEQAPSPQLQGAPLHLGTRQGEENAVACCSSSPPGFDLPGHALALGVWDGTCRSSWTRTVDAAHLRLGSAGALKPVRSSWRCSLRWSRENFSNPGSGAGALDRCSCCGRPRARWRRR